MKWTIKQNATLLDSVLEIYHGISKQKAKQIIAHAEFIKNGKPIEKHPGQMLQKGDVLEINKLEKNKSKTLVPNRTNPIANTSYYPG